MGGAGPLAGGLRLLQPGKGVGPAKTDLPTVATAGPEADAAQMASNATVG